MIVCGGVEGSTCGVEVVGDDLPSIGEEQGDGEMEVSDLSLPAPRVGVCSPLTGSNIPIPESPASDCARFIASYILYTQKQKDR